MCFSSSTFVTLLIVHHPYATVSNWRTGGTLVRTHRALTATPVPTQGSPPPARDSPQSSAIPTSLALDSEWVVVGLANSRIHVFSAKTGVLSRTLVGHGSGVWAVSLIIGSGEAVGAKESVEDDKEPVPFDKDMTDGERHLPRPMRRALGLNSPLTYDASDDPPTGLPSDPAGSTLGWGQPSSLVVSGGCDKDLRVWDVKSGYCIYTLRGHTSTIRCLKVLHHRPIAVSGSRDCTIRVWDVQRGRQLRVLEGHESSVRSLDVCGNKVVTGSYDTTCRLWDVDTGECLHVLRGHFHQVYSVAFDGVRIASGGIDTTVRVWDAETGYVVLPFTIFHALILLQSLSGTAARSHRSRHPPSTHLYRPRYRRLRRTRDHLLTRPSSLLDLCCPTTISRHPEARRSRFNRDIPAARRPLPRHRRQRRTRASFRVRRGYRAMPLCAGDERAQ